MWHKFSFHAPHYFRKHLNRNLEELYLSVALQDLALAAVVLFEPIYLFQLGFSISMILWYYVIVYFLYFFIAPAGGKFVARFGPERSILLSTIMLIMYYVCLVLVQSNPIFFWIAPVFFALQKMWYWPAYHTDFLVTSDRGERGREYSALWTTTTLMYILGPVLGGIGIALFGFTGLFVCAMILILLSNIPLFLHTLPWKPRPYSYRQSIALPFQSKNIRTTVGYLGLGEELILLVIWPIFIALTFKDYVSIGGVIAGATLLTALITLYIGKKIDEGQRPRVLTVSSLLTSVIWFGRLFIGSGAAVFISDTMGRIVHNMVYVGTASLTYDRASRQRSPIAYAVLLEQGFALGKLLLALAIIALISWLAPFTAAFVVAGLVSLLYLVLAWTDKKSSTR